MQCKVTDIFVPDFRRHLLRLLIAWRVSAGFPSPAEDYIESRIDLNKDLIHHPLSTFYVRVGGDSMQPTVSEGEILVVDKMVETKCKDVVVAIINNEFCVKRLRIEQDGKIWLDSDNENYESLAIDEFTDFEVWGKVMYSIKSLK